MKLRSSDILQLIPDAQFTQLPDGRLLVRKPSGLSLLGGLEMGGLQQVLDRIDGRKTVEQLCQELSGHVRPAGILRLLQLLLGELLRHREEEAGHADRLPAQGLRLLGNGKAVELLRRELELHHSAGMSIPWSNSADLEAHLKDCNLLACLLEDVPYRTLFEVQRICRTKGIACLFLTRDPDGFRAGPSSVPEAGPCIACALLANFEALRLPADELLPSLLDLRTLHWPEKPTRPARQSLSAIAGEIEALLSPQGSPRLLSRVELFGPGRRSFPVLRRADCPLCRSGAGDVPVEPASRLEVQAGLAALETAERLPSRVRVSPREGLVSSIGILGGGTAGYLAALALRKAHPQLRITLIESSQVPVIGVGEATTPLMPQFLHVDLGLDIQEFFRAVQPTFKLGIQFQWGPTKQGHFNYPFGSHQVLEAQSYDGHIRHCSLQSMLMSADRLPLFQDKDGGWMSGLGRETAYHLDNRRFVAYLQQQAERRGVRRIEARIADVEISPNGEEVRALLVEDGRRLAFDFCLDCSGFPSLLLEKSLGSPFVSYQESLLTDCAVVAAVPNRGLIRPYTLAEAMSAGWCWNTPMRDSDHRGYVFCSDFQDPEEAAREMRQCNPGMGDWRLVRFRAGRHQHFWKGNVAALGNAYGFVEPLESTALHMLIRQIGMLTRAFPLRKGELGLATVLNRRVNRFWDYLHWFLALHYRFNRRMDTPFWRRCRQSADVSGHAELIESFRERGPLSYDRSLASFDYPDPLWGAEGIDVILLGQQVPCRLPLPLLSGADWEESVRLRRRVVQQAEDQAAALRVLGDCPQLLEGLAGEFGGAGAAFLAS